MEEDGVEMLAARLPPLLHALDGLHFLARHFEPGALAEVLDALGPIEAPLRAQTGAWPERFAPIGAMIDSARAQTLDAYDALREAAETGDVRRGYRAMRGAPRASEILYPLAAGLPPVSRHFLPFDRRAAPDALARLQGTPERQDVGVAHIRNDRGERGGFSIYVPEFYAPEEPMPLVMALHGGAGHGRDFLWSWLRDARCDGAILIAPTAIGETWALNGEDPDSANLAHILERVRTHWSIDEKRMLITGMSDGGTFCYVSGLAAESPFTHLAPIAASFHPILAAAADRARVAGLPIHITHGVRDWMFPVMVAQEAARALAEVGADVRYRELDDLSHTYPREINREILAWLAETAT